METTPQVQTQQAVGRSNFKEETVNAILRKITAFSETGELTLPNGYNAGNALNAAYLYLLDPQNTGGKNILQICTKDSIANALFEMVTMGLSVVKKQCYFIPYGNVCKLSVSYVGDMLMAKRDVVVKQINPQVIYEGDVFEYKMDMGLITVTKHESKLENINNDKIIGAYCIVETQDGYLKTTIMNKVQIQKAWMQGAANGNSPAHKNFPEEMSKKTVISRALKLEIGSAFDEIILNEEPETPAKANLKQEIKANANKEPIAFENANVVDSQPLQPETSKEEPAEIKPLF